MAEEAIKAGAETSLGPQDPTAEAAHEGPAAAGPKAKAAV
jgi:hypothetical protein